MTRQFPDPISVEAIRQRAYEIWEREGRPVGKSAEHWLRAEAELRNQIVSWSMNTERWPADDDLIYFWDYHG